MSARETEGGAWIDAQGNDERGHVNIYSDDPRGEHGTSIHININYEKESFSVTEKEDGEKTVTDRKCFLTTASMRFFRENFNDNCYELRVLRWFRDMFVTKEDIKEYYEVAPLIVEKINQDNNSNLVYEYIFDTIILDCIEAIENGNYEFAYKRYKDCVEELLNYYLKNKELKKVLN